MKNNFLAAKLLFPFHKLKWNLQAAIYRFRMQESQLKVIHSPYLGRIKFNCTWFGTGFNRYRIRPVHDH